MAGAIKGSTSAAVDSHSAISFLAPSTAALPIRRVNRLNLDLVEPAHSCSDATWLEALAPAIAGWANKSVPGQPCSDPAQTPQRHSRVVALLQLAVCATGPPRVQ